MLTLRSSTLLLLFSSALAGPTGCTGGAPESSAPRQRPPLTPPDATAGRQVTVVKVKAPWYAFDFILPGQFRKTLPVYQRIPGLRFKAYCVQDQGPKYFGGIYLWDSAQRAQAWYTPQWFADVEQKRGHRPTVDSYALLQDQAFVPADFDYQQRESASVTVFVHAVTAALRQQCLTPQPGLLRTYLVREAAEQQGVLLLFATADQARAFLQRQAVGTYDWFKTPVLLNNAR